MPSGNAGLTYFLGMLSSDQRPRLVDMNTSGISRALSASAFAGNVTLVGGAGDDLLTAGPGNNHRDGGSGTNLLVESGAADFTLFD